MEVGLNLGLQIHLADHLRNPVRYGGNPERSGFVAFPFLGNLDPLNGWWEITPRRHPIPELVQIVLQICLKLLYRLPVYTRRSTVRLHPPERFPNCSLRNPEWLRFLQ
jgi:hypothetical protein